LWDAVEKMAAKGKARQGKARDRFKMLHDRSVCQQ
jgi:hypothetical protein